MSADARRRILERRARFVAAALTSVIVAGPIAVGCADEDALVAEPSPCLSVAADSGAPDTTDTGATPCLSPPYDSTPLLPTDAPTFDPPAGEYAGSVRVTIVTTSPGAVIYYTLDGTTPNISSPKYTAPLTLSSTTTVKAVAQEYGRSASEVRTALYSISVDAGADADARSD